MTIEIKTYKEFLDTISEIKISLLLSDDLRKWLKDKNRSVAEKVKWSDLILDISIYQTQLENKQLIFLADKFDEFGSEFTVATAELQEQLVETKNFIAAMDTLGRVIGIISQVVSLSSVAGVPPVWSTIAAFAATEKMATLRSAGKASHRKDFPLDRFVDTLPPAKESVVESPVKNAVEEVLYGVELTPESLIITVATGGCTEEDSFHIDVNKGYTGLPPYLVTVYRVKPDDCLGHFEPIRIAFSRKDLGLEGLVEFRVLNRIGNTSNHRLLP